MALVRNLIMVVAIVGGLAFGKPETKRYIFSTGGAIAAVGVIVAVGLVSF